MLSHRKIFNHRQIFNPHATLFRWEFSINLHVVNLWLLIQAEAKTQHFSGKSVGDASRQQAESFHGSSVVYPAVLAVGLQARPLPYADAHRTENHSD